MNGERMENHYFVGKHDDEPCLHCKKIKDDPIHHYDGHSAPRRAAVQRSTASRTGRESLDDLFAAYAQAATEQSDMWQDQWRERIEREMRNVVLDEIELQLQANTQIGGAAVIAFESAMRIIKELRK
jgi:hypothetical protein